MALRGGDKGGVVMMGSVYGASELDQALQILGMPLRYLYAPK